MTKSPRGKPAAAASGGKLKKALANHRPRTLGRRPGNHDTRNAILDAAETVFSKSGYAGTSLREIAAEADINQALVHHYFGSKEGLFHAVFLRRGSELANERLALLDNLETREGSPPRVNELVRAYLLPAFNLKRKGASGNAFIQLQSRVYHESEALTDGLRSSVYDDAMQRYIAAFKRAIPNLDAKDVYWRMVFALGAYLYTISDQHRIASVSKGVCDPGELDETFQQLVAFLVGGLTAAAASEEAVTDPRE